MPLDRAKYMVLISKILDTFSVAFGKDMLLIEKTIAIEHMGFFKIKYKYLPLEYDINFDNDRGTFSILIYDCEGACGNLGRIEKFDCRTTVENVKNAVLILKKVLEQNNFNFYFSVGNKIYRKNSEGIKRIKRYKGDYING